MATENPLTRNQKLVLDVLRKSRAPLSAYEILDHVREEGVKAPLQIYRALEALNVRGMTHRLESLSAYVACADKHCSHGSATGFIICEKCGKTDEFSDIRLNNRMKKLAEGQGFHPVQSMVEIKGICAKCG